MQTVIQNDGIVTLEEALANQNTSSRPMKTFVGVNTGNKTFTMILTLFELSEFTEVANDQSKDSEFAQRKLDMPHAKAIARYILKGLLAAAERKMKMDGTSISDSFNQIQAMMGTQPYLSIPPLVASFRGGGPNGANIKAKALKTLGAEDEIAAFKIFVDYDDIFWIVDGQHRRKALQLVFEFLDYIMTHHKYPSSSLFNSKTKNDLSSEELRVWYLCQERSRVCTVAMEVHLGLTIEQERQLFHDLNNLAKKVDKNIALQFDGSNPVNTFIKEVLIDDLFDREEFPLIDKGDSRQNGLTRQELVAINAILFLNKTNINGALPDDVDSKMDVARNFWEKVLSIEYIKDENGYKNTIATQPVVLKALGKLFYDFYFGRNKSWVTEDNQQKLFERFAELDFSTSNKMWQYYNLNDEEKSETGLTGLEMYLPDFDENEGYKDLGNYDPSSQLFRFGTRHNDIYPILADMFRWKLELPSRKK